MNATAAAAAATATNATTAATSNETTAAASNETTAIAPSVSSVPSIPSYIVPPYMAMHVRMGDGAAGTAMPTEKWFRTDRRLTHAEAMHMVGCALKSYPSNVLVSTDNAMLRTALTAHDAKSLAIKPFEMEQWAHEAVFFSRDRSKRPLQRVYAWAGPRAAAAAATLDATAFGATNETAFKTDYKFAEARMLAAFTELGLLAGARCLVPSPKTDFQYDKIDPVR